MAAVEVPRGGGGGGGGGGGSQPDNLLGGSQHWSADRPKHIRVEADFVTCTQ
jgi:hypothetical protein